MGTDKNYQHYEPEQPHRLVIICHPAELTKNLTFGYLNIGNVWHLDETDTELFSRNKKGDILKVQCPNRELCHNPSCMHFGEHEPLGHGPRETQNCHDELSACPLVRTTSRCERVPA